MGEQDKRISDAEWDLMEALWERKRATARELAEALAGSRGWARTTVKTMLDRMAAKGLVAARQVGNTFEYTPAVEPEHARRSAWKRFISEAFGGAVAPALQFIATDAKLTPKQRERLRKLLDDVEVDHE